MNPSTGCSMGSDNGPGGKFRESLTWAEKCWSLACAHPSSHPPSYRPWFVLNSHKLESFGPLLKLTLMSMKICGRSLSWWYDFVPSMLTLMNCTPASQFLRVCFSFQQRGRPMNPKLGTLPSAGGKLRKMWWEGFGALIFFACANVLVSLWPSDYQENCHECSNHENGGGWVGLFVF